MFSIKTSFDRCKYSHLAATISLWCAPRHKYHVNNVNDRVNSCAFLTSDNSFRCQQAFPSVTNLDKLQSLVPLADALSAWPRATAPINPSAARRGPQHSQAVSPLQARMFRYVSNAGPSSKRTVAPGSSHPRNQTSQSTTPSVPRHTHHETPRPL